MKLVCFDCDSTLSAIEGIDELGRFRGPDVLASIEQMTNDAMNGTIPVESVFRRRLELIRPTRAELAEVGRRYVEHVEPAAKATVATLQAAGWTPVIVSGGYTQAIRPLATLLGIESIEAVEVEFDERGAYRGYDAAFPTTRSGGKAEVLKHLRHDFSPSKLVMVGDGVSDLEAKPQADLFVGYGGYAVRERVKREADAFIRSLAELPGILR